MTTISVPYHLDEQLEDFAAGVTVDRTVTTELPSEDPWRRMAVLYEQVARAVAGSEAVPVVVSGDCTTSLGVLAGLQRGDGEIGIVWLDAHADFHTEDTTTSGYLGGMPLALAVGVGTLTLPTALGLRPVPESQVLLVDARDTDPGERDLLAKSSVRRTAVDSLHPDDLPPGRLYLHLDLDVCSPEQVPDLLYPTAGGPGVEAVLAAVARVIGTGRVAAVGLALTWRHDLSTTEHRVLVERFVSACGHPRGGGSRSENGGV